MVFTAFVQPIWVDPLFNHFGPVRDQALESKITQLAGRAGIEGAKVYDVNKSIDTNMVNAYVTGIGSTKRIVLWDTALKGFSPDAWFANPMNKNGKATGDALTKVDLILVSHGHSL